MRKMLVLLAAVTAGTMPASAQKADDYLGYCSEEDNVRQAPHDETCEELQKRFKQQFPKAMRGHYQSQRNVAFWIGGKQSDNKAAFRTNNITACAWRIVIIASGDPEVWSGDTDNLKYDCGKLDEVERAAAQAQASALIQKIAKR